MQSGIENKKLVLESSQGEVVRSFFWDGQDAKILRRLDTKRIEVRPDTSSYDLDKVEYQLLGELKRSEIENKPFSLNGMGSLKLVDEIKDTAENIAESKESAKFWWSSLVLVLSNPPIKSFVFSHRQLHHLPIIKRELGTLSSMSTEL